MRHALLLTLRSTTMAAAALGVCASASLLALALLATPATAQTRPLYVTDGSGNQIYIIQNGTVTSQFAQTISDASALAVGSTIHTLGAIGGNQGQEYTLGGTPVGGPYTNTTGSCCFYDGTTDGTYNYASGYTNRQVWRGGLDWSSLTPLFNVAFNPIGITYDSGNNSLWLGNYDGNNAVTIFQYAMNGTLLSSFTPSLPIVTRGITALAYDQADQTLWFSNYTASATMYQYTRSGTQLSSVDVTGTAGGNLIGAEFQPNVTATPEPATLMLLGTGLTGILGIGYRRRRRWT